MTVRNETETKFFDPEKRVRMDFLEPTSTLPLVLQPLERFDPVGWAATASALLTENLLRYGAILFRGFDLPSVPSFERFASALCPDLFGEYGDLPRESMGEKVYESTPYPPEKTILFHNESSHMHRWPLKQWFYCSIAASERGETPIVDCRRIYKLLDESVVRKFEEKKLLYVRNFVEGLDVSWQDFFKTNDRPRVAKICQAVGMGCEWAGDGGLRIHHVAPAVARHPRTAEMIFFNQLQLHHVSYLEADLRESLELLYGEEGLPRNVYYGDGSSIPDSLVQEIEQLYWENAVQFSWQEGDVLMVDNMLVAHARNPYIGPRKIVVAMGELVTSDAVD